MGRSHGVGEEVVCSLVIVASLGRSVGRVLKPSSAFTRREEDAEVSQVSGFVYSMKDTWVP